MYTVNSNIQGCQCFKHDGLNICLKHSFNRMCKTSVSNVLCFKKWLQPTMFKTLYKTFRYTKKYVLQNILNNNCHLSNGYKLKSCSL